MIKRTQHSLKFITAKKREMLDKLFVEYQRVVNEFIGLYWNEKKLASKATATQWRKVTTWLCGKAAKKILEKSKELNVEVGPPEPILMGRHLIETFHMKPGKEMGVLLKKAMQAQLDGEFATVDEAFVWVEKQLEGVK